MTIRQSKILLCGLGGQGIVVAGVILAEAAMGSGRHVSLVENYGPEARGGSCVAGLTVSGERIDFPFIQKPSLVLVLSPKALGSVPPDAEEDCVYLLDESIPDPFDDRKIVRAPILCSAAASGYPKTANIIAASLISAMTGIASETMMEEAVRKRLPEKSREVNLRALALGRELWRAGGSFRP